MTAPNDSTPLRAIRTLVEWYHPRYVLTVLPPTREPARALARDKRPLLREIAAPASGARAVFETVPQ